MFLHHRSNIDQQKLLFYHLINKKLKNSKTWKHQPSDSVMFLCSRVSRVKGTRQGHRRLEIQLRTPQKQLRKKNHKTSATKLYTQYSVIFLKAGAHTSFFSFRTANFKACICTEECRTQEAGAVPHRLGSPPISKTVFKHYLMEQIVPWKRQLDQEHG